MKYLDQASMGLVMIFGQIIGAIWGTILVWFSLMNFSGPDHYDKTGA
jgi:glycerol uptake facilitator-like aquaporin